MKFVGREDILSPLVILRQHALAYNRIIALGTDSAETLCSRVVLLSGGLVELKGNLVESSKYGI